MTTLGPKPRTAPSEWTAAVWPVSRSFRTGAIISPPATSFETVLEARRSVRTMARAPIREVLNFVDFATMSRLTWGNLHRSYRPAHSAGALHGITTLVLTGANFPRLLMPRPATASVDLLKCRTSVGRTMLAARAKDLLPMAHCDMLVLIADRSRFEAVYEDPDQLIWRDAGALMQTLHLCATAARLGFCPVGIDGSDLVCDIFGDRSAMIGVGVAMVGGTFD